MKKNKMMRLASALLVCTMLSTSVISGTFAKYVTTDSAGDTARVAKWGVTVEASGNLFGKYYAKNDSTATSDLIAASSTNVANGASDGKNIVAPGTKNDTGLMVKISGTPETEYTITANDNGVTAKDIFLDTGDWGVMVEATGLNAASDVVGLYTESTGTYTKVTSGPWVNGTTYYKLIDHVEVTSKYFPIDWKVDATGNATAVATTKDLTAIYSAMKTGITAGTHNANSDSAASYTLTWEWPINGNDGADTILGDLMTGTLSNGTVVYASNDDGSAPEASYASALSNDKYNLDVAFGISVTVTQVD